MPEPRILISMVTLSLWLTACGPTPASVNDSGHEPYLSGDYSSSLELYERASEREQGAAEPRYNSGNALYRMEEYGESLLRYDESLRNARGELRSSGFFNRGNTSFRMGQYAEAIEAYKETLRINPGDADAKHNLELALLQLPPQAQAQAQEQDEQQQDEASQERDRYEQAQDLSQERSEQAQDDRQDEQSQADRQQDQESSQETPPAQDVSMSDAGARQILESVGEEAQTLQERRGQVPGVAKSSERVRLVGPGVKVISAIRRLLGGLALISLATIASVSGAIAQDPPSGDPLFVRASVDNDNPYMGQQVAYVFRIYRRSDFSIPAGETRYQPPGFAGFWNSEMSERREYSETIGAHQYSVVELRTLLFPTVAGRVEIGAGRLSGHVGVLESDPVVLNVRSLPPGAPAGFTGAVGRFEIAVEADSTTVGANEPARITVRISGVGNIDSLPELTWAEFRDWRLIESPSNADSRLADGQITGVRTYDLTLVPERAGELTIPAIEYAYFDPELEQYVQIATPPIVVSVLRAGGSSAADSATGMRRAEQGSSELMPLMPPPSALGRDRVELTGRVLYWAAWIVPALLVAGGAGLETQAGGAGSLPSRVPQAQCPGKRPERAVAFHRHRRRPGGGSGGRHTFLPVGPSRRVPHRTNERWNHPCGPRCRDSPRRCDKGRKGACRGGGGKVHAGW